MIANLAASALHFGDNMLRFGEYPEPSWIAGPHVVDGLWFAITPLLAIGWWLARRSLTVAAIGVLWLYGVLSLFVLGHYIYAPPSALPLRINILVGIEAVAAGLLLIFAPFLAPRSVALRNRRL